MREVAGAYGEQVEVRVYQAGRDMDYVAKYGPVMRGTLFIDERIRIERLSRAVIEEAITTAVKGLA